MYDTPGQELCATSHLQWIQQSCSDVQIVFFCIKMNDQFRPEDQQALASLTKTFNNMAMWSRVVVILTHANQVKKVFQTRESDETYYNRILSSMSRVIKTALGRITNSSIVVPIVPVGLPQDFSLPGGCSDWRSAVIKACGALDASGLLKRVVEDTSLRVSHRDTIVAQEPEAVSNSLSGSLQMCVDCLGTVGSSCSWLWNKIVQTCAAPFRNRSEGLITPLLPSNKHK